MTLARPSREVMDIRMASEYLGISADTLYRYVNDGFIPGFRMGNRWRFRKAKLDEWMDSEVDKQLKRGREALEEGPKQ